MLARIIIACIVGAVAYLICVFAGGLLATTEIPIAVFVGGFLVQWAAAIAILAALWSFFAGGFSLPTFTKSA